MATAKIWDREQTQEDRGYIHTGSIDRFRSGSYAETALETDTLERENYWTFAMFHGPSHSKALIQEHHRPNIRTNLSVGVTNYMTQSADHNKTKSSRSLENFNEVIESIADHPLCDRNVMTILAYMIVQNELSDYLSEDFELDFPEIYEDVTYFVERSKGHVNSDDWTGKVKLNLPKYEVIRYLGKKKSEFYKVSAQLASICKELFGHSEGIL